MHISQISFGKKIPITTCKIKDIRQNKLINAEVFEYDCHDESDIGEVENASGNWIFISEFIYGMRNKKHHAAIYNQDSTRHFYTMEADDKIVGIVQVEKLPPEVAIEYIESEHDKKYKYIGQNFIKILSAMALKERYKKLCVPIPIKSAHDFYVKKCGFKENRKTNSLKLSRIGMFRLIHKKQNSNEN